MSSRPVLPERVGRCALWVVFAVALVVRVAAALWVDGFRRPEVAEYDAIARNLLAGRGFVFEQLGVVYYSYIAPLPAWLSAGSYWLAGSLAPAMCIQILAGAALAPATAAVAHRLFGGWLPALSAGMLVALHPGLTLYSAGKLHALAFDSLFFTLALLQSYRLAANPKAAQGALLGLVIGVGALSRGTIVIFLPVTLVWAAVTVAPAARRRVAGVVAIAALCAAAVVTPWSIRNTRLHGRFVWLLTTDSEVFWRGNNPYATGTSHADDRRIILEMLPPHEMRDLVSQPNELAQAEWFATRARAWIGEHPGAFAALTAKKFFYFWWFSPQAGLLYPRAWFYLYQAYYVSALILATVGVWRIAVVGAGREATRLAWLLAAYLLALSGLQSLHYVEGRHRWAVEPMVLALSGGGLASLAERGSRRRRALAGIPAVRQGQAERP